MFVSTDGKTKKMPVRAQQWQSALLKELYERNPHPSEKEKAEVALKTGLEKSWVKDWFQRQRALTRNGFLPKPPSQAPAPPTATVPSFRATLIPSDLPEATNSSRTPANPAPSVSRRRKPRVPDKLVQASSVDHDGSSHPLLLPRESIQHDEVPHPDLLNPVGSSHVQSPAAVPPSPLSVASAAFPFDNPATSFGLLSFDPLLTSESPSIYSTPSFVEELGYANLFPEFAHITSAPLAYFSLDNTLPQQVDQSMLLDISSTPNPPSPSLHGNAACLPLPISYTIERSKLNALVCQVRQNRQRQLAQGLRQTDSIDELGDISGADKENIPNSRQDTGATKGDAGTGDLDHLHEEDPPDVSESRPSSRTASKRPCGTRVLRPSKRHR